MIRHNIYITEDQKTAVSAIAEIKGVDASEIYREFIQSGISKYRSLLNDIQVEHYQNMNYAAFFNQATGHDIRPAQAEMQSAMTKLNLFGTARKIGTTTNNLCTALYQAIQKPNQRIIYSCYNIDLYDHAIKRLNGYMHNLHIHEFATEYTHERGHHGFKIEVADGYSYIMFSYKKKLTGLPIIGHDTLIIDDAQLQGEVLEKYIGNSDKLIATGCGVILGKSKPLDAFTRARVNALITGGISADTTVKTFDYNYGRADQDVGTIKASFGPDHFAAEFECLVVS